jgi:hypothetical protein
MPIPQKFHGIKGTLGAKDHVTTVPNARRLVTKQTAIELSRRCWDYRAKNYLKERICSRTIFVIVTS